MTLNSQYSGVNTSDTAFAEPTDTSPVSVPEGWVGGAVSSTGGNIVARRWVHERDDERLELTLPPSFEGVQVERYVREGEQWEHDGFVEKRDCPEQTEEACLEIAERLMDELPD